MDDNAVRLLDIAISQATRKRVHVVVALGPADVVNPVVDAWIAECAFQWKRHVHVDLSERGRGRGPVRTRDVGAALFAMAISWRYIPRPTAMRTARFGRIARKRNVLLRLDSADGQPLVEAIITGTPRSLVIATSRRRIPGLVAENPVWVDLTPAHDPSQPDPRSRAGSEGGQDR